MMLRPTITLVLIILSVFFRASAGRCEPVFDPPGERLSIHPLEQRGEMYGAARDAAAWHVSQWNNPSGALADFKAGQAANGSMVVAIDRGTEPRFRIEQNGEQLRCEQNGAPLEFDGFIGTNTLSNNPGLPSAEHGDMRSIPLSKLGSLTQEINLKLNQANLVGSSRCAVSKSLSIVCVVFTNKQAKQSFFYQIALYGFNVIPKSFWWAKGRPNGRFGYNQITEVAANPWAVGESRGLKRDILPAVRSLITTAGVGIDPNLDNWFLSAAYFGNTLYGQVSLQTEWSSYRLEAVVK